MRLNSKQPNAHSGLLQQQLASQAGPLVSPHGTWLLPSKQGLSISSTALSKVPNQPFFLSLAFAPSCHCDFRLPPKLPWVSGVFRPFELEPELAPEPVRLDAFPPPGVELWFLLGCDGPELGPGADIQAIGLNEVW
jgi:hypothetical protein